MNAMNTINKALKRLIAVGAIAAPLVAMAQSSTPGYDDSNRDAPSSTGTESSRSTGRALDDSAITAKVKTAFVAARDVSALDIKVDTTNGVVHLSGTAKSKLEADKAVSLARNVSGVQSVVSDIQVSGGSQ